MVAVAKTNIEKDYLLLKWGTLKGWNINFDKKPKLKALFEKYFKLGTSMSVACQKDTPEQKKLICQIIDSVTGKIQNDWTGKFMTKKQAKKYVMEYGTKSS